jgi:hypothetical protein
MLMPLKTTLATPKRVVRDAARSQNLFFCLGVRLFKDYLASPLIDYSPSIPWYG